VGSVAEETGSGGVSDANHSASFVPTIDGMGPVGGELYGPREFTVVSSPTRITQALSVFLDIWSSRSHELAPQWADLVGDEPERSMD
jgi:hypothetical protein